MKGLWLQDRTLSFRDDLPVPRTGVGEALVRVDLAGICRTDIELLRGYYPYRGIPGHEFVGTVVEAPASGELEGKMVVGEINSTCGDCPECRSGRPNHCRRRSVLGIVQHDGVFAEFITLPVRNLHPVPKGVSPRQAVFAEPLAAAMRIREQVEIGRDDRVLLIGAGKLGQLIARALVPVAGRLTVLARYPRQRALLKSLPLQVEDEPPSGIERFDLVIEATGSPAGLKLASDWVRPEGTIVLKSTYAGAAEFDVSRLVVDEVRLLGSRCGPFTPALSLMKEGGFDAEPLIEVEFSLEEGLQAFTRAQQPGAMKVLITSPLLSSC